MSLKDGQALLFPELPDNLDKKTRFAGRALQEKNLFPGPGTN